MKRLLLFLLVSGLALAQGTASGNITAAGTTCGTTNACVTLAVNPNVGAATVNLSGTFSATIQFEGSTDGVTWSAASATPIGSTTAVTSATSAGTWRINAAGLAGVRVRGSTYASGTVVVKMNSGSGSASSGGSGAGSSSSGDALVNSSGSVAGVSPGADGACMVASGGAWVRGSCAGGAATAVTAAATISALSLVIGDDGTRGVKKDGVCATDGSGALTCTSFAGTGAGLTGIPWGGIAAGNQAFGIYYGDRSEIAAPANPAALTCRQYVDSTTHKMTFLNSAGGSCLATSGGITNSAGNNVFPLSDGTNIITSPLSYDGSTTITSTKAFVAPSFSTTAGSVAGLISVGNGTAPSLTANAFNLFAPPTITTGYGWSMAAGENASAGVLHLGAAASHVSAATVSGIVIADITDKLGDGTKVATTSVVAGTLGCAQYDVAGKLTNTGSACGSASGLSNPMTTTGDIIYASNTATPATPARLAIGSATQTLHGGTTPAWGATSLTADVSGILPVANGGTNNAFFTVSGPASSAKTYTYPNANATMSYTVASGTSALATGAITSAACASVVTTSATGTATTDVIAWGFNGDPTGVTGYTPVTTGALTIFAYPSADNVNFKVCNLTGSSITPGAITLNWRVAR